MSLKLPNKGTIHSTPRPRLKKHPLKSKCPGMYRGGGGLREKCSVRFLGS